MHLSSAQAQHALAPGTEVSKHSNSSHPVFDVRGTLGQLLLILHPDPEVKSGSTQHQGYQAFKSFDESYKPDMISSLSSTLR